MAWIAWVRRPSNDSYDKFPRDEFFVVEARAFRSTNSWYTSRLSSRDIGSRAKSSTMRRSIVHSSVINTSRELSRRLLTEKTKKRVRPQQADAEDRAAREVSERAREDLSDSDGSEDSEDSEESEDYDVSVRREEAQGAELLNNAPVEVTFARSRQARKAANVPGDERSTTCPYRTAALTVRGRSM